MTCLLPVRENITKMISNIFEETNFIREKSENKIQFLYMSISKIHSGTLETRIYKKLSLTHDVLSYNAQSSTEHRNIYVQTYFKNYKANCSTLITRKIRETHLLSILSKHDYPHKFIEKSLETRYISRNKKKTNCFTI